MGPEGPLPFSQGPTTDPYHEPDASSLPSSEWSYTFVSLPVYYIPCPSHS